MPSERETPSSHARAPEPRVGIPGVDVPLLINPGGLEWVRTIPAAGDRSPEYAMLHEDPASNLATLLFRTPVAVHIKLHTHARAETHVVLEGGTHVFVADGVRYEIRRGGFLRIPGGIVHEAWLPAGSMTVNVEESGWSVNWLGSGPSIEDVGVEPPPS